MTNDRTLCHVKPEDIEGRDLWDVVYFNQPRDEWELFTEPDKASGLIKIIARRKDE